ncbi:MAG TPA: hypothetical protein VGR02_19925 [Thermoanaerobaculia bacterium]|nr:hypothetical protein [Thermoanaerobaculia bacterium]
MKAFQPAPGARLTPSGQRLEWTSSSRRARPLTVLHPVSASTVHYSQ